MPWTQDWDLNVKLEIRRYYGSMKGDEFYNWLNTLEKVFTFEDLADHKKVTLVAINQSGKTDAWREQLQTSRQQMGGLPAIS